MWACEQERCGELQADLAALSEHMGGVAGREEDLHAVVSEQHDTIETLSALAESLQAQVKELTVCLAEPACVVLRARVCISVPSCMGILGPQMNMCQCRLHALRMRPLRGYVSYPCCAG